MAHQQNQAQPNQQQFDEIAHEAEALVAQAPAPPAGTAGAARPPLANNSLQCVADSAKAGDANKLAEAVGDLFHAKAQGLFSGWDLDRLIALIEKILPLIFR